MPLEQKISDYPIDPLPIAGTDIVLGVRDLQGVPTTVVFQYQQLFANVSVSVSFANTVTANTIIANYFTLNNFITPPSSNSDLLAVGAFGFDNNYLYVGVANNYIRRIALQDF